MPGSPVGEGRQMTSARLVFNSRRDFIKENLYCPFSPLKRAKWTDFDFSWLRELKTREVALLPLWHFHHKLGGACWIQSLWAVKISGLNFIHLSNAQSLGPGDSVGARAVVSYMLFCCYSELAQVCPPQVREEALWNATSLCCLSC